MTGRHHESPAAEEAVAGSSDRAFGLVFAAVFAVVTVLPLLKGHAPSWWALVPAAAFLVLALAAPDRLRPLNRLWLRFGLLLNRIVSPLVLGLLFYLVITPMAIAIRMMGKDLLNLRWDKQASTYWVERKPPGPEPETMRNQF